MANGKGPPRKIKGFLRSNYLSKSWYNSINKWYFFVTFLGFGGLLARWFSVFNFEKYPFLNWNRTAELDFIDSPKMENCNFFSRLLSQNFDLINFWNSAFLRYQREIQEYGSKVCPFGKYPLLDGIGSGRKNHDLFANCMIWSSCCL